MEKQRVDHLMLHDIRKHNNAIKIYITFKYPKRIECS